MESSNNPKTGSQPMNLTKLQQQMMSSLPAGGRRNIKIVKTGQEKKMKKVRPEVQQQLMKKLEPKTPGGDVDPETGDLIPESVKKAGHPESFELGLDAETTENPEYQKILRQKRVERAKQMLNPKLARTMGDDVSQDDIEAADRAARRRKRVDEAMGNEDSEYQRILQSMRANAPVLRALRGAKSAGDGMVSVKPTNLSRAEDKKLEKASRRKFNPRNVGKDAY